MCQVFPASHWQIKIRSSHFWTRGNVARGSYPSPAGAMTRRWTRTYQQRHCDSEVRRALRALAFLIFYSAHQVPNRTRLKSHMGTYPLILTICGEINWRPLLSNKPAVRLERVRLFLPLSSEDILFFYFFPQKFNGDLTLQFWSSAAISRSIFPSSNFSPLDYLTTWESFYIFAYICIANRLIWSKSEFYPGLFYNPTHLAALADDSFRTKSI